MDPAIVALISGSGTAIIALAWKAFKAARFGKLEDEALATKNAKVAVEAVSDVLDDLRKERIEQRKHISRLELRIVELEMQVSNLKTSETALKREVDNLTTLASVVREEGRIERRDLQTADQARKGARAERQEERTERREEREERIQSLP